MAAGLKPDPSPTMQAQALRMYLETAAPLRQIARFLDLPRTTFNRRIKEWNWPPRPIVQAIAMRPAGAPSLPPVDGDRRRPGADDLDETGAPDDLALRLQRLVARRIDLLEAEAAIGRDADPERTDRRLIQLQRLLTQLRKGREGDGELDDTTPPARNVAELRDELVRHLERLRQQARSRKLRGQAESGGAADPAALLADPGAAGPDPA